MFEVAAEAVFVEQHAVEDAALLAGGGRLDHQLATARREPVERGAAGGDVEPGRGNAAEQDRAGLELIVERADEPLELGDRIAELQFLEEPGGVPRERAVAPAGGGLQQREDRRAAPGELGESARRESPGPGRRAARGRRLAAEHLAGPNPRAQTKANPPATQSGNRRTVRQSPVARNRRWIISRR